MALPLPMVCHLKLSVFWPQVPHVNLATKVSRDNSLCIKIFFKTELEIDWKMSVNHMNNNIVMRRWTCPWSATQRTKFSGSGNVRRQVPACTSQRRTWKGLISSSVDPCVNFIPITYFDTFYEHLTIESYEEVAARLPWSEIPVTPPLWPVRVWIRVPSGSCQTPM